MPPLIAEHLIRPWGQHDFRRYGVARLDIVRVDELDQSVLYDALGFGVVRHRSRYARLHEKQLVNKALRLVPHHEDDSPGLDFIRCDLNAHHQGCVSGRWIPQSDAHPRRRERRPIACTQTQQVRLIT